SLCGASPLPPRFRPNPMNIGQGRAIAALAHIDFEFVCIVKRDWLGGGKVALHVEHGPGAFRDVDTTQSVSDAAVYRPAQGTLLIIRGVGVVEVPTRRIEAGIPVDSREMLSQS